MQYDPIKRQLGIIFNQAPFLRKLFYRLLDLLLLRSWHIRKALKNFKQYAECQEISILDAGSGFGQYCYRMSKMFPNATILGVDVKEEQVSDCNRFFDRIGKKEKVSFQVEDLTRFRTTGEQDLILSVDVMEHILEDEQVFENFFHSLRPGGVLLISTPSDLGGSDSDHHDEHDVHGFIDEHVRDGYNQKDISDKLKRAGFSHVEVAYTYGKYGSVSWKLSMKYPIQLLGISKVFYLILPVYYLLVFPFCLLLNYTDTKIDNDAGTGLIVNAVK